MYEEVEIEEGAVSKLQSGMARKWQHLLDMSAPHTAARWGISALVMITYGIRIYLINGAPLLCLAPHLSSGLGGPMHARVARDQRHHS